MLIFQTSSLSESEEFEQYGYIFLRDIGVHPGRIDVISVSNPQTLSIPAEFGNESLAIEAIKRKHPHLVLIDRDPWRQWSYT